MSNIAVRNKQLEEVDIPSLLLDIASLKSKISNFEEGSHISFGKYTSRKLLSNFQEGLTSKVYSVSPIYDKTSKIFSGDSTAISEMVAHALSYNHGIRYKDTPFNSNWEWTRADITQNSQYNQSIGSVMPADRYISGALVQYDEGLPVYNKDLNGFRLSVDPLVLNKNTQIITVGLTLRIADNQGNLHFHGNNEIANLNNNDEGFNLTLANDEMVDYSPSSVYVENTFFINNIGLDLFEIKSNRNYGGSISVQTSDPKMYAVREMVERAVYELILTTLPNQYRNQQLNLRQQAKLECDIKPNEYTPTQKKA